MTDMEQKILAFVKREYLDEEDDLEIDITTPLLSSGIVDSFSMVSLKTFLERQYGVHIPDAKATPEAFDTVAKICRVVLEHQKP